MAEEVETHIQKKYSLIKKIGSGAYGHVWRVTDKKNDSLRALKKIFDAFQHPTDAQRTYREIVLLREINHPNIIRLENVIRAENDKDLYLVFEYMEADLHNAISQKILKDQHQRFILYQLAKGIKYLHSAEVIHRDLKPSNILLNSDCKLKICDFGLARSLNKQSFGNDSILTEEVATRWYRAPEVLLGSQHYDKPVDVWSIGCIMAEMLIGKPLFPGTSTLNQLQRILSFTGKPRREDVESLGSDTAQTMIDSIEARQKPLADWFKSPIPPDAISLVVSMLQFNPSRRPTIKEILKHPYMAIFSRPKEEIESKRAIEPPVSDNSKLSVKQYRQLIYEHIKLYYRESHKPQQLLAWKPMEVTDVYKSEPQCVVVPTSEPHVLDSRQSAKRNNSSQKISENSHSALRTEPNQIEKSQSHSFLKMNSKSGFRRGSYSSIPLKHEVVRHVSQQVNRSQQARSPIEDESLVKKNSLKDLLSKKNSTVAYRPPFVPMYGYTQNAKDIEMRFREEKRYPTAYQFSHV